METPMNIHSAVIAAAVGCALITTSKLSAQGTESQVTSGKTARWELVVPGGAIVPTGVQRDAIKRGNLTAVQLTYVARPTLAITSTFGWARSRDIATAGDPKLDVFTYDVGAEIRAPRWLAGRAMTFSPFAGVGAGGRSYNYRKIDVAATHNVAAYASAGGELSYGRLRLRLEARDYVTGFKPLDGVGAARTGNDIVVMAGLRLVSR
jgi:hypothetical protein